MATLTEKEFTVIDRIDANGGEITQRQISQHTGLSLGLTNIILKRLTKTGYIKVTQLTPKKMHYILTRKGLAEKARKSYNYVLKTIKEIKNIQNNIQNLLLNAYRDGNKKIGVLGNNELTEIIKAFSLQLTNLEIIFLGEDGNINNIEGIDLLLDCRNGNKKKSSGFSVKTVNLFEHIVKNNLLLLQKNY